MKYVVSVHRRLRCLYFIVSIIAATGMEYAWYEPLRSRVESDKSAERFKQYTFLSDALGDMRVNDVVLSGGTLTFWDGNLVAYHRYHEVMDYQINGNRIGILFSDQRLIVKDLVAADSLVINGGVHEFQLDGRRIAVLGSDAKDDNDVLKVKEGQFGAPWIEISRNFVIKSFQLASTRIGIVVRQGDRDVLRIKDGSLEAPWIEVKSAPAIYSFQFDAARVGVLYDSLDTFRPKTYSGAPGPLQYKVWSKFAVKQGDVAAPWVIIREHCRVDSVSFPDTTIKSFHLYRDRIGMVENVAASGSYKYDVLLGQDSSVPISQWTTLFFCPYIKEVQFENGRIGVLWSNERGIDSLLVKDGNLDADWTTVGGGNSIRTFSMHRDDVVIVTEKSMQVRKGDINLPVVHNIAGSVDRIVLAEHPCILTLDGCRIRVGTTGANFVLGPSFLHITEKIPAERHVGSLILPTPTCWSLRKYRSGAIFLTGRAAADRAHLNYWLRMNGDGLIMLQAVTGGEIRFSVDCRSLRDTTIYNTPNFMLWDSLGGVSFQPIGWRWGETARFHDRTWRVGLSTGQYLYISVFPPKLFDWSKGNERIFWYVNWLPHSGFPSQSYIESLTDTQICDFNTNIYPGFNNVLLIQSEASLWLHWNREYSPRDSKGLRKMIEAAHNRNLIVLVYTSPAYFTKGSRDHQDYDDKDGKNLVAPPVHIRYGENSEYFLAAIKQLLGTAYCPDGVYLDEIYEANLPESYRTIKQIKTMLLEKIGVKHRIMLHATWGLLTGGEAVFCPTIDAYADFVTRGEQGGTTYSDARYTDDYYRRYVSCYNMSNSVGLLCNYGSYNYWGMENIPDDDAFGGSLCRSNFIKYRTKIQQLKSINYNARCYMHRHSFINDESFFDTQLRGSWFSSDYFRYLSMYPTNEDQYPVRIPGFDILPSEGFPNSTHYITLIAPRGSERVGRGNTCEIVWQSWNVREIDLAYSVDNGTNFIPIIEDHPTHDCSQGPNRYVWQLPPGLAGQCLMRIKGSFVDLTRGAGTGIDVSTFIIER